MATRKSTTRRETAQHDILQILAREHEQITALMDELSEDDLDPERRSELYRDLRNDLLLHTRCEELEFYPECRNEPRTRTMADESLDDHLEIERRLLELDRAPLETEAWLETFEPLREVVLEHFEFEESDVFLRVEEYFDDEVRRAMATMYLERRRHLEQEPEDLEPLQRPTV